MGLRFIWSQVFTYHLLRALSKRQGSCTGFNVTVSPETAAVNLDFALFFGT